MFAKNFASVFLLLCSQVGWSQTIDSLTDLQSSLPVPAAMIKSPDAPIPEVRLTAIFYSKKYSQAQFLLNSGYFLYSVGDVLPDGSKITSILPDEVIVKNCSFSKKCKVKKYFYVGR